MVQNDHPPNYKIKKGYTGDFQGWYFDQRLVNYVAIWASPKYAVTVGKIMDAVNERYHLKNITFEAEIAVMKVQHDAEVASLKATIAAKDDTIVEHSKFIQKTAVPEDNSDKNIWVIRDNNGSYRIRADSSKNKTFDGWVYQFTYPASMNIKQKVNDHFGTTKGFANEFTMHAVVDYIKTLSPKITIEV
jgi:hypothetical protein